MEYEIFNLENMEMRNQKQKKKRFSSESITKLNLVVNFNKIEAFPTKQDPN